MRIITLTLVSIVLFLIDLTLIPFITLNGVYSSLLFVFISLYIISDDYDYAIILGLITGFLQDIYSPYGFGINILLNIILFIIFVKIGKSIKKDKRYINILLVSFGQTFKYFLLYVVYAIFNISSDIRSLLLIFIYSFILSFIFYNVTLKFKRIPFIKREWKF